MAQENKEKSPDPGPFLKFIKTLVGSLGGVVALLVAFGYITLQNYLSFTKLYGLTAFPQQFYKEASISLLRDFVVFYFEHLPAVLIPAGIFLAVYLIKRRFTPKKKTSGESDKTDVSKKRPIPWKGIIGILGLVLVAAVVLLPFAAVRSGHLNWVGMIFNTITLPVLVILFLFLAIEPPSLKQRDLLRSLHFWFVTGFILLFISIPFVYGFYLFDVRVFTASVPYCTTAGTPFGIEGIRQQPEGKTPEVPGNDGFKLLYLVGHTSEREIFFDATKSPVSIILVDRKLINSIEVEYDQAQYQTIRTLFGSRSVDLIDLVDRSVEDAGQVIKGKLTSFDKAKLDDWMTKDVPAEAKEKKNDDK